MKAYPHYKPSGTMPLDIYQSKVIKLTKRLSDELESCDCGTQCKFLNNGAKENDPNQFAIKLFDAEFCWDALGAYERQKVSRARKSWKKLKARPLARRHSPNSS
jgi:hypothetical protein